MGNNIIQLLSDIVAKWDDSQDPGGDVALGDLMDEARLLINNEKNMSNKITEQDLIEYGFEKSEEEMPVWPYQKNLSEEHTNGRLVLVVTLERNSSEFALAMPNGDKLFLRVKDLDHLKAFEESIQSWDPHY